MEFWQKAQAFAEQAAKRSTELTKEAAKRSHDLTIGSSKLSDIVSEASKKSKEIAAEASKRADLIKLQASMRAGQFKTEALKRADQIKSQIPSLLDSSPSPSPSPSQSPPVTPEDLETFGITDALREFLNEITANTFRDFPLEDDSEMSDIPTISNVRQDLTEWQERHAKYVLSTVKAISKLRYELCPRVMKERKFWRIYFILVNSHVAPWEKWYNEEARQKSAEKVKEDAVKETSAAATAPKTEKIPTSTAADRDLDVFLLGDLDSDDNSDDGDAGFDDDLNKILLGPAGRWKQ